MGELAESSMGETLFSIIVPVYQVEPYLEECVDSVLSQSFRDFQLILIDDGSPDHCPEICDAYERMDSRVRVIHQKNQGLSAARNTGIQAAAGTYVLFLDSDDILCHNALMQMAEYIRKYEAADLILGNIMYWQWQGGSETFVDYKQGLPDQPDAMSFLQLNLRYVEQHIQLPWSACNSVYKRSFLLKNALRFREGLSGAEDVDFYLHLLRSVRKYVLTGVFLIKYRQNREGSIITTPKMGDVMGKLRVFSAAARQGEGELEQGPLKRYFAGYFAHSVLFIPQLKDPADRQACYQFVRENRQLLNTMPPRPEYQAAKLAWKWLGLERGTGLLAAVKRIYKSRGKAKKNRPPAPTESGGGQPLCSKNNFDITGRKK